MSYTVIMSPPAGEPRSSFGSTDFSKRASRPQRAAFSQHRRPVPIHAWSVAPGATEREDLPERSGRDLPTNNQQPTTNTQKEGVTMPTQINPKLISWASDIDPGTIRQAEKTARL